MALLFAMHSSGASGLQSPSDLLALIFDPFCPESKEQWNGESPPWRVFGGLLASKDDYVANMGRLGLRCGHGELTRLIGGLTRIYSWDPIFELGTANYAMYIISIIAHMHTRTHEPKMHFSNGSGQRFVHVFSKVTSTLSS